MYELVLAKSMSWWMQSQSAEVLTRWEYSKDEASFWKVSLPYKLLYTRSAIAIYHRQKIMQNRGTHQVHAFTRAFSKN